MISPPYGLYTSGTAAGTDHGRHHRRFSGGEPLRRLPRPNSVDAAIEAAHMNDAVGDIITRDLVNAVPPNTNFVNGTFTGYTDSIDFLASGGDSRSTIPVISRWWSLLSPTTRWTHRPNPRPPCHHQSAPAIEAEPVDERSATMCRSSRLATTMARLGTRHGMPPSMTTRFLLRSS